MDDKVTVEHCLLEFNYARDNGGAIGLIDGAVHIDNCIFRNNSARYGGGTVFGKWTTINNSTFEGNVARTGGGAVNAVYLTIKPTPSYFINNEVSYEGGGGAIFTSHFEDNVKYATFINNQAPGVFNSHGGGAIYIYDKTTVTFSQCVFVGNRAGDEGGAIYADSRNTHLTLLNNIFINNDADEGKSVYNCGKYDTIRNNYYSNNPTKDNDQLIEWEPFPLSNVHHVDSDPLKMGMVLEKTSPIVGQTDTATHCFYKSDGSLFTGEIYDNDVVFEESDYYNLKNKVINSNSVSVDFVPKYVGTYTITANLYSKSVSKSFNVDFYGISAPEITTYYGGPQTLEISIEGNKDVVADQIVKVSFNSKNYEAKTDGDGIARVLIDNIPSELGKYNITVNVYDKYVTSAVTVLSTIGGSDVAKFYGDGSQFEVRFTDKNGQYLNMGKLIGYQIDNLRTKYSPILNNEGIFDIDISSLGVGEHNITVFNLLTKENTTFTITILPGFGNENNHNNIPQSNSPSKDYSGNVNSFDSNSLTGDLFYDYSLASDNLNATDEVAGDKGNVTNHSTNSPVSKAIDNTQSNGGNNNLWWIILAILAVIAAGAIIKKYKE